MRKQRGFMLYAALGGLVVIIGLSVALSVQSSRLRAVKAEYEAFQTQVRVVGEAQEARTKAEIARQKEVTKNVEKDYAKRLTALRADYARLRDSRSGGGDLSRIPTPPASIDAIPADAIPLAAICAETTEQLVTLQDWIRLQSQGSK